MALKLPHASAVAFRVEERDTTAHAGDLRGLAEYRRTVQPLNRLVSSEQLPFLLLRILVALPNSNLDLGCVRLIIRNQRR